MYFKGRNVLKLYFFYSLICLPFSVWFFFFFLFLFTSNISIYDKAATLKIVTLSGAQYYKITQGKLNLKLFQAVKEEFLAEVEKIKIRP